jgi:hypothetical protein
MRTLQPLSSNAPVSRTSWSTMTPPECCHRFDSLVVEEQRAEEARKILAHDDSPADHGELPPESANQREPFSGMPLGLFVGLIFGIAGAMGYMEYRNLKAYDYTLDRNGDDRPDDVTSYKRGYPVSRRMDLNFDRRMDYWEFFDQRGQIERSEMDNNSDGKVDGWGKFRFGQITELKVDTDFNGQPDLTYFHNGFVLTNIDWHPNGSKVITVRESYVHGVLSEQLRDLDQDGRFDISVKFDPFFQPTATNHLNTP